MPDDSIWLEATTAVDTTRTEENRNQKYRKLCWQKKMKEEKQR